MQLVGVTPAELDAAKSIGAGTRGTHVLLRALRSMGIGDVTDPGRACATADPSFAQHWRDAAAAVPE